MNNIIFSLDEMEVTVINNIENSKFPKEQHFLINDMTEQVLNEIISNITKNLLDAYKKSISKDEAN